MDAPHDPSFIAPRPFECPPSSLIEADTLAPEERIEEADDFSSLTSSIVDYEFENGRRYHAYKAGYYPLPNDESELDRLDLQHHVITLLLNGELYLAPLNNPTHVLDIGTGTGLWAIEMADRFPTAQVIGTDLSPVQPTWVPDNVNFEIDDVESDWLYQKNSFDLIHSRYMIGALSDWKGMITKAYRHCKPGGFLEIQELDPYLRSDDRSDEMSPHHKEYINLILQASKDYGKPVPRHTDFKGWMEEAGFVDIREHFFKIPVNSWPKDKRLKEIGKYQCLNYSEGLEGISIGLFTRVLKWQPMEFSVFLARIRTELRNRDIHIYQRFAVVTGRKPFPYERAQPPSLFREPLMMPQNIPSPDSTLIEKHPPQILVQSNMSDISSSVLDEEGRVPPQGENFEVPINTQVPLSFQEHSKSGLVELSSSQSLPPRFPSEIHRQHSSPLQP